MSAQFVWTFQLVGGQAFQMTLPNNPSLDHDGHRTLWQMVGTEILARQAAQAFQAFGVHVNQYAMGELPEQTAERQALLKGELSDELADLEAFHGTQKP